MNGEILHKGEHFERHYEVIEPLPPSGQAQVYLVRHASLETLCVLELLRDVAEMSSDETRHFRSDLKRAAEIQSEHLTRLYDYSVTPDGTHYSVWEHCVGDTVSSLLERRGPFDVRTVVELAIQALEGLEALHDKGVLHHGISPETLLLMDRGDSLARLKIAGLSIARGRVDVRSSESNEFKAHRLYCSPELAGAVPDHTIDQRSDLYSLALVLYQMISGRLPFEGENHPGGLQTRFRRAPIPLIDIVPIQIEVPDRVSSVIMRCLSVLPEKRHADASAMRRSFEDLRRWLKIKEAEKRDTGGLLRISQEGRRATDSMLRRLELPRGLGDPGAIVGIAERAMKENQFEIVRACIDRLEMVEPTPFGLAELRQRLTDIVDRRRRMQVMQTQELLENHLRDRRASLASVALELLMELDPKHPQLKEYEWRISSLGGGSSGDVEPETLFRMARKQARDGDIEGARDRLAVLEAQPEWSRRFADELRREIEISEAMMQRDQGARRLRQRLEESIESGQLDVASQTIEQLADLGVPKAVTDLYRSRIREASSKLESRDEVRRLEIEFPTLLSEGLWSRAREAARQIARLDPDSPVPARMLQQIDEREAEEEQQQALEEGRRAFEHHLRANRVDQAELALKTLLRLAPDHPERGLLQAELARHKSPLAEVPQGPQTGRFMWSKIKGRMRGSSSRNDWS